MKRPLLGIMFVFCLGILLEEVLDIPVFFIFVPTVVFLLVSALSIKTRKIFLLFILASFLFLGGLTYKHFISLPKDHIKNIIGAARDTPLRVLAQGYICDNPSRKVTYYKQLRTDFVLNVSAVKCSDKWQPASGLLPVRVFGPEKNLKYGDEIILEGDISPPRPPANPGQFYYKKFLERKNIFYQLTVKEGCFYKATGRSHISRIKKYAYIVRQKLSRKIDAFVSGPENAMLQAILLGQRQGIEDDIYGDFTKTGTIHILSISGLHVALLASIFMLLLKVFRIPLRPCILILSGVLIFYCVMVDNQPPVLRSTIMIIIFLFGRFLRKESDILNSLAFAALAILFFNPQDLFDIGFQLSFLTVGSIVYFTPKLEALVIKGPPVPGRRSAARIYIIRLLLASFSAWLGSALIVARYFNIFSPVTIIANIFVVPWVFLVLSTSLAFILISVFSYVLGLVFAQTAALSVTILLKMVSFFSGLPFSYFMVKSPPWIFILVFYAFLLAFFNRARLRIRAKYFLIIGLVFLDLFVWKGVFFGHNGEFKVTFLDVGKGDSMFVEFPGSGNMLIDAGEGLGIDMGRLVVGRFLASEGINTIDLVIATHPHTDHIGGLVSVLKNFRVRYFMDNGDKGDNSLIFECRRLIKQKRVKSFVLKEGDSISGFGKARLYVLNPPAEKFNDTNNDSLVLKMEYDNLSVMFCGDIKERAAKRLLIKEEKMLPSTVLKIPHHGGSLGDTGTDFIEKINPEFAVVSLSGREIDERILLILNKLRSRVYRTDTGGAIFLKMDKNRPDRPIMESYKNN